MAQSNRKDAGAEEAKKPQDEVEDLVDKNMINLLRVCSML